MAYGLKYFSEFADDQEIGYRVEIHERDYSGDETEVISSGNPFILEVTEVDNIFSPIRTKKATIEWVATEEIAFEIKELDLADDQKYKVFLYEIGAGETLINKFTGYLVTVDCKEPFGSKPYPVQLSAACGLFFLRDYYFTSDNGEFVLDKINIKNTIGQCLQFANLELDFHTYVDLYDIQMGSGDPLALADFAADGLRGLTCYDALSGVLNAINAFVVQEGDVWVIKGIPDSAALICPRRIYDFQSVFKSQDTPNQAVSIGREPFNGTIPNLIPTESVTTSLAETSSVVKMTVEPGIPVNRLRNGQFAYPITGGNLVGWDINLNGIIYPINGTESPGWTRSGFGTIDSPYRFEMRGYGILTDQGKDKDTPSSSTDDVHIDIEDPIIIDGGLFGVGNSIKLVVSGAFRARSFQKVYIECRINDGDRDYVSWLDESGKWSLEKKKRQGIKIDVKTPFPDISLPIDELPIQTFEVISEPLNNFLNQGGRAIAKIYFRVFPGMVYGDVTPEQVAGGVAPMLALEDFSVSVTTETIYEGAHTYVVDADLPIRNANEIQFTSIVADKINIVTPEQVRLVNRVMTGYMTIHNTDNLTYGWRRRIGGQEDPIDGVPYPIQYKVLKERIRQVCGKRIIVEGDFLGYDLNASSSVFLQYDDVYDNSKFYTITNWKWDVINRRYSVKLNELSLTKLSNSQEFIELDKEGSGSRGNRLYGNASGGSSSGNGSSSPDIPDPIELDIIDPLYFVVGQESTQSFDLGELIISGQVPADLASKFVYYPSWMLYPYEDRGEDGDLLTYTVTGTPLQKGHDQIIIEFVDPYGVDYLAVVPIIIEPKTTNKNAIISGGDVIGKVPGFLELPDSWNFQSTIKGTHDKVVISVSGGGVDGSSYSRSITREPGLVEDGTYTVSDTAIVSEAGVYEYSVITYRGLTETSREEGSFTLYDEEYLAKFSSEFIDFASSEILGVINPNGTSTFKQKSGWDIKSIITDLEHDNITYTLKQDGVVVFNNSIDVVPAELEGEYLLFNELQTEYGSGDYELLIDVNLDESPVYQRLVSFSIAEEEVKPEAGLKLIEFTNNTTNYSVTQDLPLFNAEYDLPDNWGVLIPPVDVDYDYVEWELSDSTEGSLANVNIENYTNYPQYQTYLEGQEKDDILIFGIKNSLDIGDIHRAPSTFRVKATFRLGGATGKIVAITQSDFGFREPLQPEDYSGTRFINLDVATNVYTVVDENMPIQGRKYLLPEIGTRWSVSVRELNGETFNKVVVKLSKKLSGSYEVLHFLGEADSVLVYNSPSDVNELPSDNLASVIGFVRPDGLRYLFDVSNNDVLIDGLGDYKVTFDFYLGSTLLGSKVTEFSLIDGTIPDIPVKDCCGSSADLPIYDVAGEWGGDNQILKVTLTENGTISSIEEQLLDGVTIEDNIWNYAYPPKSVNPAVDDDDLVNYSQLTSAVAAGSSDKQPVKTVATSNITLSGNQTINGFTTITGDRVLVTAQADPKQNGSYVSVAGAWQRSTDADTGAELLGATYLVTAGNSSVIGTKWKVINTPPIVIGSDNINIVQIQAAESDPTVGAWIKAITSTQITNWDAAYSIANNFNSLFDTRFGIKTTTNLAEGTNLYFTEARVRATPLTGYTIGTNAAISPTDSVLTAFGKLEAKINATGFSGTLNYYAKYTSTGLGIGLMYDSGTRVGIGTASPSGRFHVSGSESGTGLNASILLSNAAAAGSNIWYLNAGGAGYSGFNNGGFSISDNTNFRFTIASNGRVGIGLAASAAAELLQVGGNTRTSLSFISDIATGTAPIFVNSTTRVTNLNSDLLDDQHGAYYLARVNQTGIADITPGTGLTGSSYNGLTAQTWQVTYGTTAGTAAQGNDPRILAAATSLSGTTGKIAKFISGGIGDSIMTESSGLISTSGTQAATLFESNAAPNATIAYGYRWRNGNSARWELSKLGLESGSNVGSDMYLARYADNGAYLGNIFSIVRATGLFTFSQVVAGVTPTSASHLTTKSYVDTELNLKEDVFTKGNIIQGTGVSISGTLTNRLVGSGDITISGLANGVSGAGTAGRIVKYLTSVSVGDSIMVETSGRITTTGTHAATNFESNAAPNSVTAYGYSWRNGTSARWELSKLGLESGSNSGSDMYFARYADNGAFLGNIFSITRSSGLLTFSQVVAGVNPTASSHFLTLGYADGRFAAISHTHTFDSLTGKPTTIAGYGITDVYNKAYIDALDRVPGFRIISAGTGLTGGGNLYADRSFAVVYGTTAGTSAQGNDSRINNGQTAFSWGDHNGLYYNKAYIDAIDRVPGSRIIAAGTGLFGGGNLYADRSFSVNFGTGSGQVAQGDDSRINNGQTAFSWGNHASAGYLTGITSPMVTGALTYTPIPNNRTITINGNTQFLNDNPNFTISSSGGNITGSGTNGYVTRWTGGTSIGNSRIIDNGSGNINFVGTGLDATNMSLSNNFYAGSGSIGGTFSANNLFAISSFTLPTKSEAGLSSAGGEGSVAYVNSGSGKGLWVNMGSNGWRLIATRLWVGSSNPGSSPP